MECVRIDYSAWFRVDIRHDDPGYQETDEPERGASGPERASCHDYDIRNHIEIQPTWESLALLRSHRLLFRPDATGFTLYASVSNGILNYPFQQAARFRFHLIAKDRREHDRDIGRSLSPQIYLYSNVSAKSATRGMPLAGRFLDVPLGDSGPTLVAVEVTDREGNMVNREEFRGTRREPLKSVTANFGPQPGGMYRTRLKDGDGNPLKYNGVPIEQADFTLYADRDAVRRNVFAVVEIESDSVGCQQFDSDDSMRSPAFLLRIPGEVMYSRFPSNGITPSQSM